MFRKSNSQASVSPSKQSRKGQSFSVIGAEVTICGDLLTPENVQLNGTIHGDIECTVLHQGASGLIRGNVVADEARLAGLVDGRVSVRLLILAPTARVTGDVAYETLAVENGARVEGRFVHQVAAEARSDGEEYRPPADADTFSLSDAIAAE